MKTPNSSVCAILGAQWGSEGKGVLVHSMAHRFGVHVRVGGPNAGHTFKFAGRLWKMRSLPCGWTNPEAVLLIGPGAVVDLDLLDCEITDAETAMKGVRERVSIDARAAILTEKHRVLSVATNRKDEIGGIQEGVSVVRAERAARIVGGGFRNFGMVQDKRFSPPVDTTIYLKTLFGRRSILLEGTQGTHLSLVHGEWPYVTSADTTIGTLCADVGIAPSCVNEVVLVARTFPIRVGGNSGDLPHETDWEHVSEIAGRPVREFTTVSKRLRRVAYWNDLEVQRAIWLNGPTFLALMFLDYLCPQDEGKRFWNELSPGGVVCVEDVERDLGTPIRYIGTGGPDFAVIDRGWQMFSR